MWVNCVRHLLGRLVFDSDGNVLIVILVLCDNGEEATRVYERDTVDTIFEIGGKI